MRICRFCGKAIGDQDEICKNCGYNPQTDTMTASFVKKEKKTDSLRQQKMVSPAVMTFMLWGIAIIVFSLGIKYQGKIGDIFWNAKNIASGNKVNKSAQVPGKVNPSRTAKLIDVRSYKAPVDKVSGASRKIEGIFYDPQGKSYVIINGQLVSERQNYAGLFIKKINSDSVEVIEEGKEKLLKVNK